MKKIFSILAIAAAMMACSKDDATTETTTEVAHATYTLKGYSSNDTRTEFGTPEGNRIPFHWSEGDKILVLNQDVNEEGGTASEYTISAGEGTSSATFVSGGGGNVVTPDNGKTVCYNLSAKKGGFGIIDANDAKTASVPAEQSTAKTLGENGDFGYAVVEDGAFTLQHATAYLWFDIEELPEGYTLESIRFDAGDAIVAGNAKWNGSDFDTPTNGSSVIELAVDENATKIAMVVLPTEIESATITYELGNATDSKLGTKTLSSKTIESGKTYKISVNLTEAELYELRVLTFEEGTEQFENYSFEYYDGATYSYETADIYCWSDLIAPDGAQYGHGYMYDPMGGMFPVNYWWCDEGNTGLGNMMSPLGYPSGGHAISNYFVNSYASGDGNENLFNLIRQSYGDEFVDNILSWGMPEDQLCDVLGWFLMQLSVYDSKKTDEFGTNGSGHNGSNNFAVQYGYMDEAQTNGYATQICYVLPSLCFLDYDSSDYSDATSDSGFAYTEPHVIDHMYVTNTAYTLNQLTYGVTVGGNNGFKPSDETPYVGLKEDSWFKIVATGYDENLQITGTTEFYLCKNGKCVTEWTKWDLSSLGAVVKVEFNFEGDEFMTGGFGLTIPAYFAYDDVAVRF